MVLGLAAASFSGCSSSSEETDADVPQVVERPQPVVIQSTPTYAEPVDATDRSQSEPPTEPCPMLPPELVLVCLAALGVALVALCFLLREPSPEDLCQELLEQSTWPQERSAAPSPPTGPIDDLIDPERRRP